MGFQCIFVMAFEQANAKQMSDHDNVQFFLKIKLGWKFGKWRVNGVESLWSLGEMNLYQQTWLFDRVNLIADNQTWPEFVVPRAWHFNRISTFSPSSNFKDHASIPFTVVASFKIKTRQHCRLYADEKHGWIGRVPSCKSPATGWTNQSGGIIVRWFNITVTPVRAFLPWNPDSKKLPFGNQRWLVGKPPVDRGFNRKIIYSHGFSIAMFDYRMVLYKMITRNITKIAVPENGPTLAPHHRDVEGVHSQQLFFVTCRNERLNTSKFFLVLDFALASIQCIHFCVRTWGP